MSTLPPSLAKHPELDTWVRIDPEGTVTVFTGKSEHGQGLRSTIARIGAEELDVALERVRVETADTAHGLDEGLTAGSTSTQESGAALRQAAAEARAHLLDLAAAELGVDANELRVDDGTVSGGGRTTTYWQLQGGRPFGARATGAVAAKPASEHRVVGRAARRRPRRNRHRHDALPAGPGAAGDAAWPRRAAAQPRRTGAGARPGTGMGAARRRRGRARGPFPRRRRRARGAGCRRRRRARRWDALE